MTAGSSAWSSVRDSHTAQLSISVQEPRELPHVRLPAPGESLELGCQCNSSCVHKQGLLRNTPRESRQHGRRKQSTSHPTWPSWDSQSLKQHPVPQPHRRRAHPTDIPQSQMQTRLRLFPMPRRPPSAADPPGLVRMAHYTLATRHCPRVGTRGGSTGRCRRFNSAPTLTGGTTENKGPLHSPPALGASQPASPEEVLHCSPKLAVFCRYLCQSPGCCSPPQRCLSAGPSRRGCAIAGCPGQRSYAAPAHPGPGPAGEPVSAVGP